MILKLSDELKKRVCKIVGIEENLVESFWLVVGKFAGEIMAFLVKFKGYKPDKDEDVVKLITFELEKCLLNEKIKFEPKEGFNKIVENAKKLKERYGMKFYLILEDDGLLELKSVEAYGYLEIYGYLGHIRVRNEEKYRRNINDKLKILVTI